MRAPPHLPFLHGPPEFTVGLTLIPEAHWLAPDPEADTIPAKRALLAASPEAVFREAEGSALGQGEAAGLISAAVGAAVRDLFEAAHFVSDDLVLMEPRAGRWKATAAALCSPTYFSAADAVGSSLAALHAPVPDRLGHDGAPGGLAARVARVFSNLPPGAVLERFNWTVQAGPERFTPSGAPLRARAAAADPSEAEALLHLRVERQTVRRLARTGGVLFTIRVSLDPLAPMLGDAAVRAAFARAWTQAPTHVRAYKRWDTLDHLVAALLQAGSESSSLRKAASDQTG